MSADERSVIWLASLNHVETVQKMLEKHGDVFGGGSEQLKAYLDANLHISRTLALLASVAPEVAEGAAELQEQRKRQERQSDQMLKRFVEDLA